MLKAKLTGKDGKPIYLIGLSYRNLELLKEGNPAKINLSSLQGEGSLFIFSGENEASMVKLLEDQGFTFPDAAIEKTEDD